MTHRQSFKSGCHLKAARAFAGMKQSELAALAGLHVNSIKRLEGLTRIPFRDHAAECAGRALLAKGIIADVLPVAHVRLADGTGQSG